MSTGISIYAEPGGFDSRLFFPATLYLEAQQTFLSGNGSGYIHGEISYLFGGAEYTVGFEGHNFGFNANHDSHGIATSGYVDKVVGGVTTRIATMSIFPDADNSFDGLPVNSIAWMTPDSLVHQLTSSGGVHLSLLGNTGADKLFGTNLGDYFNGEGGRDRMTGYRGNDQFLFDAIGNNNFDHITDFTHARDKILLDRSDDITLFAGVTVGNLGRTFHDITSAPEQADDRILYNHNTGRLFYDPDGRGGSAAVLFAVLDNHARLDIRDFDIF
jgi:Ca2+-binding RTX toxin-like protein